MTAKAFVRNDWMRDGVAIGVVRDHGGGRTVVSEWSSWPTLTTQVEAVVEEPNEDAWLHLPNDLAHAVYEALAEHFGHTGHDMRALRKDYDAERKRVDTFITHLTKP